MGYPLSARTHPHQRTPFTPGRVLDLCSGPGAFSFAAMRQGAREVVAIDRNQTALQMAAEVCGRYGFPLTIRRHSALRYPFPVEGKFDLIIAGHCLTELFPDTKTSWPQHQREWIDHLFAHLSPHGCLLFVESSLNHVNHRVLALRDQLVKEGSLCKPLAYGKENALLYKLKANVMLKENFKSLI